MMRRLSTRVTLTWLLLVCACAAPPVVEIRRSLDRTDWFAVASGVVIWTLVMAIVAGTPARRASRPRQSLALAATLYAAMQGALALVAPGAAVLALYTPAVLVASKLMDPLDDLPLAAPLIVTLVCGAQVFACVLALDRIIRRRAPSEGGAGAAVRNVRRSDDERGR
jgi:hypothetical protein